METIGTVVFLITLLAIYRLVRVGTLFPISPRSEVSVENIPFEKKKSYDHISGEVAIARLENQFNDDLL